jgi:hypothetical protein
LQFPKPPVFRSEATAYPPLPGAYRSSAQHPRVFMTAVDLSDMVTRINAPGTFSARAFARLANQIEHDVAAKVDWNAAYSGCEVNVYLHGFSIEAPPFYGDDKGSVDFLHAAMSVAPGVLPP